jgi:hypothetical protein
MVDTGEQEAKMRRWGVVISVFYFVVLFVLTCTGVLLAGSFQKNIGELPRGLEDIFAEPVYWVVVVALLASQALLLFVSVDTSPKRWKPQRQIWVTSTVVGAMTALLVSSVIGCVGVGIGGDRFLDYLKTGGELLVIWGVLWAIWGAVFYVYARNKSDVVKRAVDLKGSVLELLVAVPCHVIVRERKECCAPIVTSFGIVTGIAIMLLSFGPSIVFLYQKRMERYG